MANHAINDPPVFTDQVRKLETTDPQHADTFNGPFGNLINNDVWLRDQVGKKEPAIKDAALTSIADNDSIPFVDVSASSGTKRLTLTSLKATLKTYFDTLYNKYVHPSYTARAAGLYKVTVDSTGHVSGATAAAKADITALGIPAQDTVYTHPTTAGNKHIPAGGAAGQMLIYSAAGTARWADTYVPPVVQPVELGLYKIAVNGRGIVTETIPYAIPAATASTLGGIKISVVSATLTTAGWNTTAKTQTVTVSGVTTSSKGFVGLADSASDAQRTAAGKALIQKTGQGTNTITVKCMGAIPTVNIPITVTVIN